MSVRVVFCFLIAIVFGGCGGLGGMPGPGRYYGRAPIGYVRRAPGWYHGYRRYPGAAVVHHESLLEFAAKPLGWGIALGLTGWDTLVCAPDDVGCHGEVGRAEGHYDGRVETADRTEEDAYAASYARSAPAPRQTPPPVPVRGTSREPEPPESWGDSHEEDLSTTTGGEWEIKIDPAKLAVVGDLLDSVGATEDERVAFEQAVQSRTPEGKEIRISPDQVKLLRRLRKKFQNVKEAEEIDKLIALGSFAGQEGGY